MILRLLSFLPEPLEAVLASPPPPKCQFLKDPPSVVTTAQKKTNQQTISNQTPGHKADRVMAQVATCHRKEEVKEANQNVCIQRDAFKKKETHTMIHN